MVKEFHRSRDQGKRELPAIAAAEPPIDESAGPPIDEAIS
jgi:hypothetical protein